MASLSKVHRDGWGLAVFDERTGWQVERGLGCAFEDARFHSLAVGSRGSALVSHIRQRTVGDTTIQNTHPFARGRWVFAHNGTLIDLEWVRRRVAGDRIAEVQGATDSELLFAWILTELDQRGATETPANKVTDTALRAVVGAARSHEGLGSINFLLSDGVTTYANRFGRTMFVLERRAASFDLPRTSAHALVDGEQPCLTGCVSVLVASERMTDESWEEIGDGTLVRIERNPSPRWWIVAD
jgi:glutamine amidotransferase